MYMPRVDMILAIAHWCWQMPRHYATLENGRAIGVEVIAVFCHKAQLVLGSASMAGFRCPAALDVEDGVFTSAIS